jgi:DNA-binding beta-propeller fold protein YncE
MTPINTATGTPGKPIHVGGNRLSEGQIVITPSGKTVYVSTGSSVTPISTATGTPGKPIHVGGEWQAFVITP